MRIVVAGLTANGKLRRESLKSECIAAIDLIDPQAEHRKLADVPVTAYDAVFVCASNENKYNLIRYALNNKKHVLVEVPLWCHKSEQLDELIQLSAANQVQLYIANPWRYDPHIQSLHHRVQNNELGDLLHVRVFFAVNNSACVLDPVVELGAPLLDLLHFCFGAAIKDLQFNVLQKKRHAADANIVNIILADLHANLSVELEINLLTNQDCFSMQVYGSKDSVQIDLIGNHMEYYQWEYSHFKHAVKLNERTDFMLAHWMHQELRRLSKEELLLA